MSLAPGTKLGPYEVTALIGAGGMGEVYAATDPRLDRAVAIKVLPREFAEDPGRRERFEREAKAVAALSHPGIVSLYDSGVHDGRAFVVMELLSGQTLRALLDAGPPPLRKALDIAAQVARGLAAAHDQHLVHRDLKPENVFVLPDGRVKVLDFGLARRIDTRTGATETRAVVTDPGSVMGTVGYMAPEQVRGLEVDARADIFAFGAVLYELLSGRRAFSGDTAADAMFAIVKEDPPDLLAARESLPPALDRIVRHCLEKNPAERFQSARDVAFAIEALSGSASSASGPRTVPAIDETPRRRRMGVAAALVLGATLASAAFGAWWWAAPRRHWATEWVGEDLGGPTFAMQPRVSPDGQYVAFQAMVDDQTQVGLLRVGSGTWQIVTTDRTRGGVTSQSWSQDGTRVLFDRVQELPRGAFSVPVPTGTESLIVRDASNAHELESGDVLLTRINEARQPQLHRVRRGGQAAEPLAAILASVWNGFRVFRDGREVVYIGRPADDSSATRNELRVLDLETGRSRRLAPHMDLQWDLYWTGFPIAAADDWVVIAVLSGDLTKVVAVPRDGSEAVETLFTTTARIANLDVGADGAIYLDQPVAAEKIVWIRPGSTEVQSVEMASQADHPPVALPDGEALVSLRSAGRLGLTVVAPGKLPRQFTPTLRDEETRWPAARLGRDRVAFVAGPPDRLQIVIATIADGLVMARLSRAKVNNITAMAGSPDGRTLYYVAAGTVWAMPSDDSAEPQKIRSGDAVAVDPAGQHLVVQVSDKDRVGLFRVPVTGGDGVPIPIDPAARIPILAPISANAVGPDGRIAIRVAPADSWYWPSALLDPSTGRVEVLEPKRGYDVWGAGWTDDGRVLVSQNSARSRMWRFRPVR